MGLKDLPLDSGRHIQAVFVNSFGWKSHYGKNHWVLIHPDKPPELIIAIPDHKEVDRNLLKSELRKAGIPIESFCKAYRGR